MKIKKFKKAIHVIQCMLLKFRYDYISSFAAHAALFIIMSLFPLIMFLFSVLRYLPVGVSQISYYMTEFLPTSIKPLLEVVTAEVQLETTGRLQWITLIVTLLCASKGFYAIMLALNAVYGIRETRNVMIRYITAVFYVIIFVIMISLTMICVVFGKQILKIALLFAPDILQFHQMIHLMRYFIVFFILTIFFLILFMNVPDRKSKIKFELPGSVFVSGGWIVFSWAFSFYIEHLANYSVTYGSLATMIVFMMWFYVTMYILFLGAELNVTLRKYWELHCEFETVLEYYKEAYEMDLILDQDFQSINSRFELIRRKNNKK